jgi:NAD(P)-dependent dehydrogenase (short-subunit alcohol dehydrogenase family)
VPKRDPRFEWNRPVDGSDPATEWKGLLSNEDVPHAINPPSGFVYNSNDWPWDAAGKGSIVFVNSMIQKKPLPTQSGYASSKGALTAAARMLAKELGPYGIRVNSTFMGWMWGPPVEGYVEYLVSQGRTREDVMGEITKDIPLGIIPDDADCANAVVFLASDLARVITGAQLDVNGGEMMV